MDELEEKEEGRYIPKDYLTEEQLAMCKENEALPGSTMADQIELFTMIDSFVRKNGKADVEYETLFTIVQSCITGNSDEVEFPDHVRLTMPLIFMLAYFDFLSLTGVLSQEDVERMAFDVQRMSSNGGPAKA